MSPDWSKFLHIAAFVAGPVLSIAGVPSPIIPFIVHGMLVAEQATDETGKPKTGAEKKAIAMDAARTAIGAVNSIKPNTVDNNVLVAVDSGIDAAVAAVDAVQKHI